MLISKSEPRGTKLAAIQAKGSSEEKQKTNFIISKSEPFRNRLPLGASQPNATATQAKRSKGKVNKLFSEAVRNKHNKVKKEVSIPFATFEPTTYAHKNIAITTELGWLMISDRECGIRLERSAFEASK